MTVSICKLSCLIKLILIFEICSIIIFFSLGKHRNFHHFLSRRNQKSLKVAKVNSDKNNMNNFLQSEKPYGAPPLKSVSFISDLKKLIISKILIDHSYYSSRKIMKILKQSSLKILSNRFTGQKSKKPTYTMHTTKKVKHEKFNFYHFRPNLLRKESVLNNNYEQYKESLNKFTVRSQNLVQIKKIPSFHSANFLDGIQNLRKMINNFLISRYCAFSHFVSSKREQIKKHSDTTSQFESFSQSQKKYIGRKTRHRQKIPDSNSISSVNSVNSIYFSKSHMSQLRRDRQMVHHLPIQQVSSSFHSLKSHDSRQVFTNSEDNFKDFSGSFNNIHLIKKKSPNIKIT